MNLGLGTCDLLLGTYYWELGTGNWEKGEVAEFTLILTSLSRDFLEKMIH